MKKKTRTRYTYTVSHKTPPQEMSILMQRVYRALVEGPGTNRDIAKRFHKGNSPNSKPAIAAFVLLQLFRLGLATRRPAPLKGRG